MSPLEFPVGMASSRPASTRSSACTFTTIADETLAPGSTDILRGVLSNNLVQRVLSACVLAPLVLVFLWYSPNSATSIVCSALLSACAYEFSWIVYRIQWRFITLTDCSDALLPGGSVQRFNDFFVYKIESQQIESTEGEDEIRDAMNLENCAISTVARHYFCGARTVAAAVFAVPATLVLSLIFQACLLTMPEEFRNTEFYEYHWRYSLMTDFVGSMFALHTPNWRFAFVVVVEKLIFSLLTAHSSMCPINQLTCGQSLMASDLSAAGLIVLIVFHISLREKAATTFIRLVLDALGFIYLIGTMSVFVGFLDDGNRSLYRKLLIMLLCVVWAADSGAYFVGKLLERVGFSHYHAIAPHVSKNKDYEGTLAAVGFGVAALFVAASFMDVPGTGREKAAIAALAVVVGRMGDLFESLLKRAAGIKHSGALIPGHGGVLDRVDALLFAALVFGRYYAVLIV